MNVTEHNCKNNASNFHIKYNTWYGYWALDTHDRLKPEIIYYCPFCGVKLSELKLRDGGNNDG